jgi:hypothetical protein
MQGPDHADQAAVADARAMARAALALEFEANSGALRLHMPVAQGSQAEALVGPGVGIVADADQCQLQQPHHGGQNLFARERALARIGVHPRADEGRARPKAAMWANFA